MIVGEMRNLMIVVATFAIIPAILSHLKVVFVDGGCGRAGSTVAVSAVSIVMKFYYTTPNHIACVSMFGPLLSIKK